MRKRILLISDFSSIHTFNYVKNVVCHCDSIFVCVHSLGDASIISENLMSFYNNSGLKILSGITPGKHGLIGKLLYLRKIIPFMRSLGDFDFVHIHYINVNIALSSFFLKKHYGGIILSYWGSDLLRRGNIGFIQSIPVVNAATKITFITKDMMCFFKTLPSCISKNTYKCQVLDFGDMFLDKIDEYRKMPISALRESFQLEKNKLVVMIGYNGKKTMQQLKTLQSLKKYDDRIKDKIQFVVPVLFSTEEEKKVISSYLDTFKTESFIFQDFMDENTVSKFRVVTDIFIHAQTSDAFSNTMVEHFYAGSVVINGKWLNYSTLDDNNAYYHKFSNFDQLGEILIELIDNFDKEKELASVNHDIIKKLSSWDSLRNKWLDLYEY